MWLAPSFLKNIFFVLRSSAFIQLLGFLLMPVLTRLYSPVEFGSYSLYFSVLGIVLSIASLRYDVAIPMPRKLQQSITLVQLSLILSLLVSFLSFIGILLSYKLFAGNGFKASKFLYLSFLPLGVFAASVFNIFNYYLVRICDFRVLSTSKMLQGGFSFCGQLLLGYIYPNVYGLIGGMILGHTVGSIYSIIFLLSQGDSFACASIRQLKIVALLYKKFPLFSVPATALNLISRNVPSLFIASYYGMQVAGGFGLIFHVISGPLGLISQAITQVYTGQAAKLQKEKSYDKLFKLYISIVVICFLLGLPFGILLIFWGKPLFIWFFGAQWDKAGEYAQILIMMLLIEFSIVGASQNCPLFNKQDYQFLWNILFLILTMVTFLPLLFKQVAFNSILNHFCILRCISYLAMFLLNIFVIQQQILKQRKKVTIEARV